MINFLSLDYLAKKYKKKKTEELYIYAQIFDKLI
jgi:hypothetical protein